MTSTRRHTRPRWAVMLPGAMSWCIATASVVGVIWFPFTWVWVCAGFVVYFVARMAFHLVFYLVGEARCRAWARRDWTAESYVAGPLGISADDVWHVVVIPAFREPAAILRRTLDALAVQYRAHERVLVVLGMEQAEPGGIEKGAALAAEYGDRFARIIAAEHPAGLLGEVAGKASNETWAARAASRLVASLGIDPDRATITSCDADSVLHPSYLAAVASLFARDPAPRARFWHAPVFYCNNIWDVPAPVRFSTWSIHSVHLAELAMPFYDPLPLSTYTLTLSTAEKAGWWDPAVISEDWHMYLNCLFERSGNLSLVPVFLPTYGDATDGETYRAALMNRYRQLVRHAWGAEDVGYVVTRLRDKGPLREGRGIFRLVQVTHDHVMRTASWFFITIAYALSGDIRVAGAVGFTREVYQHVLGPNLSLLLSLGTVMLLASIAVDLVRCPPPQGRFVRALGEVACMWMLLPVIGLLYGMVPALYAQTRLMLGMGLTYRPTPKRLRQAA